MIIIINSGFDLFVNHFVILGQRLRGRCGWGPLHLLLLLINFLVVSDARIKETIRVVSDVVSDTSFVAQLEKS